MEYSATESAVGGLWRDLREMLSEQHQYRELLLQLTARDLILRYKQTTMGFGWAIFMPLLNTVVFSIIFTRVARLQTDLPYPVFAYCGLIVWNFFASSLRFSVSCLTSNPNLVTKVYFPREIFPFSAILVSLVDFAVAALLLVAMMVYYHLGPSPSLLFLPVVLAVEVCFTAGVALILAMTNLFYRDVKYIFDVVINLWMFATAVVYPVSVVHGKLSAALRLNPMTVIVEAFRDVILRGQLPGAWPFVWASMIALLLLLGGWLLFHRAEFEFAENL
jgi:ABC-type polysaccharide/polyol phosphate export permease